jgi:hypothetical protein
MSVALRPPLGYVDFGEQRPGVNGAFVVHVKPDYGSSDICGHFGELFHDFDDTYDVAWLHLITLLLECGLRWCGSTIERPWQRTQHRMDWHAISSLVL